MYLIPVKQKILKKVIKMEEYSASVQLKIHRLIIINCFYFVRV